MGTLTSALGAARWIKVESYEALTQLPAHKRSSINVNSVPPPPNPVSRGLGHKQASFTLQLPELGREVFYGVHVTHQKTEALSSSKFPESWLVVQLGLEPRSSHIHIHCLQPISRILEYMEFQILSKIGS